MQYIGLFLVCFLNKIFLPQITDLGRTNTLSTEIVVATPTSPTVLRIDFPTPSRKKRSSLGYTYGRGFQISLSYDEIHFSESMTVIIYNDACYSCSASTLKCNITVRKNLSMFWRLHVLLCNVRDERNVHVLLFS